MLFNHTFYNPIFIHFCIYPYNVFAYYNIKHDCTLKATKSYLYKQSSVKRSSTKDVQELSGHFDVSTTMNVYPHATREAKQDTYPLTVRRIYLDVARTFVSNIRLYPNHSSPLSLLPSSISIKPSSFASVLSAKASATASIKAGFFGEPYSSSP